MPNEKVAIVTAASRGIGAAIARRLSEEGYHLALLSRSESIHQVADELRGVGVAGSVTEPEALQELVLLAESTFGRIDALVCNTGHPPKGELLAISDEEWYLGMDLLLMHVVRLARLVTPFMERQGRGAIVNVSGFGAVEPALGYPVSSTLRAGLGAFAKLYADRYAPVGIRMNNVLPGFIDSYEIDEETRARIPAGRPGLVAELAGTVAFLLSDEAGYVTGQSLRVDGGITRSV